MILELAAISGCPDPERRTLRELDWMAEAAQRAAWLRTFAVLAHVGNMFRGEADAVQDPLAFYPFEVDAEADGPPEPTPEEIEALKRFFSEWGKRGRK